MISNLCPLTVVVVLIDCFFTVVFGNFFTVSFGLLISNSNSTTSPAFIKSLFTVNSDFPSTTILATTFDTSLSETNFA